ncbi:MAG: TetR/AcrR family transcriptional regulator [Alphaproteobacteria bacterium]
MQKKKTRRDPVRTKRLLLEAATEEFAKKGLKGARIDAIAALAGVNKQLVYHHFGSKDDLYLKVLEEGYERYRGRDKELRLETLGPDEAIRRLVTATFDGLRAEPHFAALVVDENLHHARHVRKSRRLRALHADLLARIGAALIRGEKENVFRRGIDPMQLYISIAGLASFYLTNNFTLSAVFGVDLSKPQAFAARRAHVIDMVMASLRP